MTIYHQFIARVEELAKAIGDSLQLRGFKTGGTVGQVPVKGAGGDFDWEWGSVSGVGGGGFTVSDTPPVDTTMQWFNSTNGIIYTFYDGFWIADSSTLTPGWSDIAGKPTVFPPIIGVTSTTAMAGNATPTPAAHKTSHAAGGTDALSPSDIGAVAATGGTMTNGTISGTVAFGAGAAANFRTAALVPASDPTGITGADAITNIVSLTAAEYAAITPSATTLYVVI